MSSQNKSEESGTISLEKPRRKFNVDRRARNKNYFKKKNTFNF